MPKRRRLKKKGMNQKKAKLLKKLAKSLGLPRKVVRRNYKALNSPQRDEIARELKRIQQTTYDKHRADKATA